ncbi:uncharacterized protein LOC103521831, partial [Diaphorina citri]|uniref:Uncharacterized protein LOC103521831 n=1 Tax=Diaphorina citri TaxID=121845 RepID=A0A3Q0JI91_DIACI
LMLDYGLIAPVGKGFFYNLPLAERSQQKLINLIDLAMEKLGAQRFQSPLLTATEHWKKTGENTEGSKEAKFTGHLVSKLYSTLSTVNTLSNNVIVDDRTELTIGRRLLEAKLLGYPYIVVIGKAASQTPSLFEVIDLSSDFSQE